MEWSDFVDGLSDDLKGHEALQGVTDANEFVRGYLDLRGRAPSVPESADRYEVPRIEGLAYDEASLAGLRAAAHQAGLSQEQLGAMMTWTNERIGEAMASGRAAEEKAAREAMREREETVNRLRDEWGPRYGENLDAARRALRSLAGGEFVDYLNRTGLGDHPALIRAFHRVGEAIREDRLMTGIDGPAEVGPNRTAGGMPMLNFPSMA